MHYNSVSDFASTPDSINNVFVLQQYSMYDKDTGLYRVLSDGNLNLTLHRIYKAVQDKQSIKFTVTIPTNKCPIEFAKLIKFLEFVNLSDSIKFIEITYDKNAYFNRHLFSGFQIINAKSYDLLISDFSLIYSHEDSIKNVLYTFNISKIESLKRSYIDEFFFHQLNVLNRTNTIGIAVLNESQYDYAKQFSDKVSEKMFVDQCVMSKDLLDKQLRFFSLCLSSKLRLSTYLDSVNSNLTKVIYFPFRLSDSCYRFYDMLFELSKENQSYTVILTNPNKSDLSMYKEFSNIHIFDVIDYLSFGKFDIDNRSVYYELIFAISKMSNSVIPIFEDESLVLHQALVELNHLSDVVSFRDQSDITSLSMEYRKSNYLANRIN